MRTMIGLVAAALAAVMASMGPASAQLYTFAEGVEYEVLSTDTKDPLFIQVAPDGRIFWAEREGRLEVLHPDGRQDDAAIFPVSANQCDEAWCPAEGQFIELEEGGLYSILLDRDFATTNLMYVWKSVPGSMVDGDPNAIAGNAYAEGVGICQDRACPTAPNFGVWRLSTFLVDANSHLDLSTEQVIFEVPAEFRHCCHYGGNLEWLPDGTILLSTGDDMTATAGAYGQSSNPIEGDAERSSMNPADRRGKTLRLNANGSVPDGSVAGVAANPFLLTDADGVAVRDAEGNFVTQPVTHTDVADAWDPYVYTLGYKQPFRGAVHPSGAAIFGEVGPDGFAPIPNRGPRGVEELNWIPPGGGVNHGWPRCSGNNDPYYPWSPVAGVPPVPIAGGVSTNPLPFDCSDMEPAVLWYPHDVSTTWPSIGSGGVTSAPSAFYPADTTGALRLPESFNDTLIFMEESRSGIIAMPMTDDGHLVTNEAEWTIVYPPTGSLATPLAPEANTNGPQRPIDATVGPDGAVYIVEYSDGFYNGANSRISRLKCAGCIDGLTEELGRAAPVSTPANRSSTVMPLPIIGAALTLAFGSVLARRRRTLV